MRTPVLLMLLAAGCGGTDGRGGGFVPGGAIDLLRAPTYDLSQSPPRDGGVNPGGGGQQGCGELSGCYTVYAHSDHELYHIDLKNKLLVLIGKFGAPQVRDSAGKMVEDTITDLAVAPDDTVYGISHTNLYAANPKTGQVTLLGPVTACGDFAVALTFAADTTLYTGDFKGAFCRIDPTARPPQVTLVAHLSGGLALSGDIVAVGDGTMYGTAYKLSDSAGSGTQQSNLLVKIEPKTGNTTIVGSTGFPKLFGVAFDQGKVFGFTHDGTGDVVTIDPKTGVGTRYNTFTDSAGKGISFAGAGVNAKVDPTIM